jgi:putative toxin-antitoxin system antitoxin component (TIGR02293 family)
MSLPELFASESKMIVVSRNGITKKEFLEIRNTTGLSSVSFANATHLTARTIERKKLDEKISPEASERAILIGKLYYSGEKIFGDREKFLQWMEKSNFELEGKKPKEMLDTITGIGLVDDIFVRIQHGMIG